MRNKVATRNRTIQRLLTHARYEVLPTASTEDKVLAYVPLDVGVTVTASGARDSRQRWRWPRPWRGTATSRCRISPHG